MENHRVSQVVGSNDTPYITALAHACGSARNYRSVGRPSLPNYLGATSGDTHHITDDRDPSRHHLAVDNLFRQVRARGERAVSFEESMPSNCALQTRGRYAVKHNPAAYYVGPGDRAACQTDDIPMGTTRAGRFIDALAHDTLPAFSLVTPDLCSDMHSCPKATGDAWLAHWITIITASTSYRSGSTVVFVVWDEPTPMPFVVITPTTRPGTVVGAALDHYSLLRTTEDLLGIRDHLGHAATAVSMRPLYRL